MWTHNERRTPRPTPTVESYTLETPAPAQCSHTVPPDAPQVEHAVLPSSTKYACPNPTYTVGLETAVSVVKDGLTCSGPSPLKTSGSAGTV